MRKIFGVFAIVLMAIVLVACGDDDDESAQVATEDVATAPDVSTAAVDPTATEEAAGLAEIDEATPASSASLAQVGTPEADTAAEMTASPAVAASPVTPSIPAASPVAQASPVAAVATPESGSGPSDEAGTTLSVSGTVLLPGDINQAYILTDTGCVGLGGYSDIRAGRQLIFRNESGKIIGVTTLQASDSTDSCTWNFALDVPQSEYYAVSIPMVFEYIFTDQDIDDQDGRISLPLR